MTALAPPSLHGRLRFSLSVVYTHYGDNETANVGGFQNLGDS